MSMKERFHPIDASVMLRRSGVYTEHQLFHNSEMQLFARRGNGYIRLMPFAATTAAGTFWSDIDLPELSFKAEGASVFYFPPTSRKAKVA